MLASLEFQVKIFCIVAVKIKPKLNIQTTATGIKTNHIKLEKDKEITSDDSKAAQDAIQKTTDGFITTIEATLRDKEAEILKV